ncbi:MAG: branched-chain amino acid ABC transporter permease [Brevinematales bacterium]
MSNFVFLLIIYIGIYSILALSQNLITGFTGLLSICQAGFFAIGVYTTAIYLVNTNGSFFLALLLSAIFSLMAGLLIGLPSLKLRGDYLAIATLGFGEIVKNVIINWDKLTRGPLGINNIPPLKIASFVFTNSNKLFYAIFIWIFVLIFYLFLERLIKSRFGRALEAIREDEIAASSMGINTTLYKVSAFSLSAFIAGIAGSLWAIYHQSVSPQSFDFLMSVMILCMVVLGGMGNNFSSIIGAALIVTTSELPRLLGFSSIIPPQTNQIIFGLLLILMMIYRPEGILKRKRINFEYLIEKKFEKPEGGI